MGMPSLIRILAPLLLIICPLLPANAQLAFRGLDLPAIEITPPATTGIKTVYVLPYTTGVTATWDAEGATDVKWQRFSAMGAAYAEEAESRTEGNLSILNRLEPNVGYIINEMRNQEIYTEYVWIIDYSAYPFGLRELRLDPSQTDCSTTWLEIDGNAERLPYFSRTGVPQWISRDLELSYFTLEFDKESFSYVQTEKTETIEGFSGDMIHCTPPLCQTDFTLTGDRFSKAWGLPESVTSPTYDPTAVAAETRATQTRRENDNEVKVEAAIGGSGPVEVRFEAAITDAALYHEWELARDADFQQSFMRFTDLDFTYTFREQGTVYVRFLAANESGECEYTGETYEVFVGESQLKCPNAFSPGTSPGVNDEWKVSYKSIIEFDCHIFDRQGRELAHLTDPSQGWNGKRGGKPVDSGVFFYVIRAKGADGKKYKLSGDINVIGHKQRSKTSDNATD